MFTIEVGRKGKDEEFRFEDLEMFHGECYGGKIEIKPDSSPGLRPSSRNLDCMRCHSIVNGVGEEDIVKIIQTAIDGEEREGYKNILRVIQKV